ncbi:MAG: hypothetical protein AB7W28_00790 [Armatimonadota bacterium]
MSEAIDKPCPFRYAYKGRTFCIAAIRERRFTTTHVAPITCGECGVPAILAEHPCAHLDIGVEVDEYGPRAEVCFIFTACLAKVQELSDVAGCLPGECALWAAADQTRWEDLRTQAMQHHRALEDREGTGQ